jgi:hypothetical protein
MNLVCT